MQRSIISHVVPQIVAALVIAAGRGLRLPLIYNTNAYDAVAVLRLLDGIIDIYLPDMKYSDDEMGYRYSGIHEYVRHAREAIVEIHRQVGGHLVIDEDGLVRRGLIIRDLVLPNDLAGSKDSLRWIHDTLGRDTTISLMAQYYPTNNAGSTPLLDRPVHRSEYERILEFLDTLGMDCGWAQEFESRDYYRPEFENRDQPFQGVAE